MSLLIVNSLVPSSGRGDLSGLAERISDLVRRARLAELPIAHLHQGASGAATALQMHIGRYDLVFRTVDLGRDFPKGLIEFLVSSPFGTVNLIGAIRSSQLRRLTELLAAAGIKTRVIDAALVTLDEESLV